jgi:DNA-binding transcriptional LysR family regulator
VRFVVRTDFYDPLARQLRGGDLDIMIGLSMTPPHDACHSRAQEVVWVHSAATRVDRNRPVPLVSHGELCVYHRLAVQALQSAGLVWEDVFTGPSVNTLSSAVNAGLGVMAVTRSRANAVGLTVWEDAPLPKLPDLYSGIYIREGGAHAIYEQLADEIAAVIFNSPEDAAKSLAGAAAARKANTAA